MDVWIVSLLIAIKNYEIKNVLTDDITLANFTSHALYMLANNLFEELGL